ncbi:MAG: two component transcriptional regulator, AraC family [Paenibacillaceae bacterium]|jgi:two-component system response regulator YesN|nr:two component transcriptional regulator, AraC family [Paenibacillaceae bacterium]
MYTLIIADDEEIIRNGLKNIVNWERLGFEVLETFADGREVLSYLEHHPVDVVLSDIKMTFVSGMEVARYIFERELPTKVMLISGYQELELAMAAIRYKVQDYILKPIDLDELTEVLRKIRRKLDEENELRQAREAASRLEQKTAEWKKAFFAGLLAGTVTDIAYLETVFQLLYPRVSFGGCGCFLTFREIRDHSRAPEIHSELMRAADLLFTEVECRAMLMDGGQLQLAGIGLYPLPEEQFRRQVHEGNRQLQLVLDEKFPGTCCVGDTRFFPGIPQLLRYAGNRGAQPSLGSAAMTPAPEAPEPGEDAEEDMDIIGLARQYIVEHITEDLSLEELADRFYLSPYYFSRIFKARTGENLIDFIIRHKMERAMELLRVPRYKVYEVSHMVGYKSERYFSKVFKSYAGCTPHAYRSRLFSKSNSQGDNH